MSALVANDRVDYNSLKELLKVTDGNLASHLKFLEKENFITVEKSFIDRKPNTSYSASKTGRQKFEEHIDALKKIIEAQGK